MGTIESKLSYLLRTKEEIRNAINGKGVKVTTEDTFRSYADKIRSIVGTEYYVPSLAPMQVNFKDYDGGIIHTYSKDEFLALTEMPVLPERPRLVCQGWNWSLEDAKAHVQEYGVLDIGATYITDDGKTRFYIKVEGERKSFPFKFSIDKASSLVIDWGDGVTESVSGSGSLNASHTYEVVGDYVISLDVAEGAMLTFSGNSMGGFVLPPYSIMLRKVELGERIFIGNYAFASCYSLSSVVIPNSVTSIGHYAFYNCYSLSSVVIPNSVTKIVDYLFYNCHSLSSVVIPNSVTSIGSYTFSTCYSLTSITIPNSVTSIGGYLFYNCLSLSSVVIPNGVKDILSNTFYNCYSLSSVVIPNSVTRIETSAFSSCLSLSSVVIPNSVTKIASSAFSGCGCVAFYDFRTHTSVPTLGASSALSLASDCKIVVPDALYDEWIAATNWSSLASKIVKASEFNG